MPNRQTSSGDGSYKFGFNGNEMDNEVSGTGNQYDYGFRIYNPRLGKFLSVDPLTSSYPFYSPYHFAGNRPTFAVDLDGLEDYVPTNDNNQDNPMQHYATSNSTQAVIQIQMSTATEAKLTDDIGRVRNFEYWELHNDITGGSGASVSQFVPINEQINYQNVGLPATQATIGQDIILDVGLGRVIDGGIELYRGYRVSQGVVDGGIGLLKQSDNIATTTIKFEPIDLLKSSSSSDYIIADVFQMVGKKEEIFTALNKGIDADITVGSYTLQVRPGSPFSGFTDFANNGFVIGNDVVGNTDEFIKTLLHETYRLNNSVLKGGNVPEQVIKNINDFQKDIIAPETKAASEFANKAIDKYFKKTK